MTDIGRNHTLFLGLVKTIFSLYRESAVDTESRIFTVIMWDGAAGAARER